MKNKAAQVFRHAARRLIYPDGVTQLKRIGVTLQRKEAEDGRDPVSAPWRGARLARKGRTIGKMGRRGCIG
jgi:hypothetical protein